MTLRALPFREAQLVPLVDDLLRYARTNLAKATLPAAIVARDELFAEVVPTMRDDLAAWFDALLAAAGVRKDAAFPLDPDAIDWPEQAGELRAILLRYYGQLGSAAYAAIAEQLGLELSFNIDGPGAKAIRDRVALQVKGITATLQELLRDKVAIALERGLSIDELVDGVSGVTGLADIFGSRAQTIALTETANAYNAGSLAGYAESGIVDTVEVFDGPDCGWEYHDDPDLADGSIRSLADADEFPIAHPNCQRAFGPVVAR